MKQTVGLAQIDFTWELLPRLAMMRPGRPPVYLVGTRCLQRCEPATPVLAHETGATRTMSNKHISTDDPFVPHVHGNANFVRSHRKRTTLPCVRAITASASDCQETKSVICAEALRGHFTIQEYWSASACLHVRTIAAVTALRPKTSIVRC